MQKSDTETGCCPRFEPEPWDGVILEWEKKKFIKESVCTFLSMPLNFGGVMKRIDKKLTAAGLKLDNAICLSDHTSKWNMNLLVEVETEVPEAHNVTLSGKFLCKVYEGDFKEIGNWCRNFENYAKDRSFDIKKWYMWYTTCPKCAKAYGKNYVVIFGMVK